MRHISEFIYVITPDTHGTKRAAPADFPSPSSPPNKKTKHRITNIVDPITPDTRGVKRPMPPAFVFTAGSKAIVQHASAAPVRVRFAPGAPHVRVTFGSVVVGVGDEEEVL